MPPPNRPNKPIRPKPLAAGGRPNTLGLAQRELSELLDRLEQPESQTKNPKRDFVRWPFRQASVRVQLFHPGGVSSWITVGCRNISRAGMAILHSAYVHTGTKCRVMLPHPRDGEVQMEGWITRCSHRSGIVHEIGIRFDQHLDVQDFLQSSPFTDWFSLERVRSDDLTGRVVYADASEIDRKIFKHFLRGTRLAIEMCATGAEALAKTDDTAELVLVDFHLRDMTGIELIARLRHNGVEAPIIMLTCDATNEELTGAGASAYLAKPFSQDLLLRAIAEFLIVRRSPKDPGAAATAVNASLAEGLRQALDQYAKKLDECIVRQDAPAARTLCLQIAGTVGTMGFKEVHLQATKAAEALTRSHSTAESIASLRTLIAACRRMNISPGDSAPAVGRAA